jgi:hypothetical protein
MKNKDERDHTIATPEGVIIAQVSFHDINEKTDLEEETSVEATDGYVVPVGPMENPVLLKPPQADK